MQDMHYCPICNSKLLSTNYKNYHIPFVNNTADYVERKCVNVAGHSLVFYTQQNNIDFIKFSLAENFSNFIYLDFINNKSLLAYFRNGSKEQSVEVDYLLEPDFPSLKKLKHTISKYASFL